MNDKQREWIEQRDDYICKILQDDDETKGTLTLQALYWLSEMKWKAKSLKSMLSALKEYGKSDKLIDEIKAQWTSFMENEEVKRNNAN